MDASRMRQIRIRSTLAMRAGLAALLLVACNPSDPQELRALESPELVGWAASLGHDRLRDDERNQGRVDADIGAPSPVQGAMGREVVALRVRGIDTPFDARHVAGIVSTGAATDRPQLLLTEHVEGRRTTFHTFRIHDDEAAHVDTMTFSTPRNARPRIVPMGTHGVLVIKPTDNIALEEDDDPVSMASFVVRTFDAEGRARDADQSLMMPEGILFNWSWAATRVGDRVVLCFLGRRSTDDAPTRRHFCGAIDAVGLWAISPHEVPIDDAPTSQTVWDAAGLMLGAAARDQVALVVHRTSRAHGAAAADGALWGRTLTVRGDEILYGPHVDLFGEFVPASNPRGTGGRFTYRSPPHLFTDDEATYFVIAGHGDVRARAGMIPHDATRQVTRLQVPEPATYVSRPALVASWRRPVFLYDEVGTQGGRAAIGFASSQIVLMDMDLPHVDRIRWETARMAIAAEDWLAWVALDHNGDARVVVHPTRWLGDPSRAVTREAPPHDPSPRR